MTEEEVSFDICDDWEGADRGLLDLICISRQYADASYTRHAKSMTIAGPT
jgi:hypothetical protein